jgi:basic membrane lipoprotein Med (substrate-binding protein (PBP1-ABC) superfamily)
MASWNTYAAILGRAALMDSGLSVDKECEPVYLGPDFGAELSFQALEMVLDGRVAAAIVPGSAIEKIGERVPAAQGKLRVLVESSPTSAGVVAAWSDLPKDRAAALQTALQEMDREWLSSLTLYERLAPADRPLADNMEAALRKVGLDAGQLARNEPPQPWTPPQTLPPGEDRFRVAVVPGAGMSVEGDYALRLMYNGLQAACAEWKLDLVAKETPAEGSPADTARGLVEGGYTVLVAMGWREPESFWTLARDYGQARFVYWGSKFADPLPNLVSLTYRADEAGFLAGALAGKASQSRKVAVIGGQHVPAVEQLVAGFVSGAKYACPECEPVVRFTDSYSDLPLGEKTGRKLVQEGVDVILNAAGLCGSAGIRAAAQENAWVIGIDVDEYVTTFRKGEVPKGDHLLGSVVFPLDKHVRKAVADIVRGSPASGNLTLGVAEGGVEFEFSPQVAHPRRPELGRYLEQVSQELRDGKIRP